MHVGSLESPSFGEEFGGGLAEDYEQSYLLRCSFEILHLNFLQFRFVISLSDTEYQKDF